MTLKQQMLSAVPAPGQIAVWYLGQEGILIRSADRTVLIDPYLSTLVDDSRPGDPLWTRNYPVPIAPEELDFIDDIFCTHEHNDHTDPRTLPVLARVSPRAKLHVPVSVVEKVVGMGIDPARVEGVSADVTYTLSDTVSVTPVPAAHEELHLDETGNYRELGYRFSFDGLTVYHAGDSCVYDGLAERVRGTDLAFLPINGRDYFRLRSNIIGNMDALEALLLAEEAGFDTVVPMHHDLYPANGVNPAHFADLASSRFPYQKYKIFVPGERIFYAAP